MAVWPFGRKSKANQSNRNGSGASEKAVRRANTAPSVATPGDANKEKERGRRDSSRGQGGGGRKLTRSESRKRRRQSAQSTKSSKSQQQQLPPQQKNVHEPMPVDAKATADQVKREEDRAAAANAIAGKGSKDPGYEKEPLGELPAGYQRNATSKLSVSSENRGSWQTPPTLRAKRGPANDGTLVRRKSSKKRKKDHEREEQIKRMTSPVPGPRRPATHGGGPIREESKKDRERRPLERPISDLSLPIPESIHSSFSSSSADRRGFKVRSLDVLSPRPTIRYSAPGPYPSLQLPSGGFSRSSSKREKRSTIPEETINQSKTIDELADDLDAGALRELMDRDERRRERKRKIDEDRAHRRLQRKAEKQKEVDEQARQNGVESPKDMDRGMLGRESIEPEQGESSSAGQRQQVIYDDREKQEEDVDGSSPLSWLRDPSQEHISRDPFADSQEASTKQTSHVEKEEGKLAVQGTDEEQRISQATASPPASPRYNIFGPTKTDSTNDLPRQSATDVSEMADLGPRASTTSEQQLPPNSWTNFFRRSLTRSKRNSATSAERGRHTPSEFSNTSRDSLQRPPRPVSYQPPPRRKSSGPPVRTQSKFREDLPEYPSPPDSRMQSPEVGPIYENVRDQAIPERAESSLADKISVAASSVDPNNPFADPSSGRGGSKAGISGQEHSNRGSRSIDSPSPAGGAPSTILSQSLASIDSEGSWLSGKRTKRNSQPLSYPLRGSAGSLQKRYQDYSDSAEELGVAEDEYFSRLTPGPESSYGGGGAAVEHSVSHGERKPSSNAIATPEIEPAAEEPGIGEEEEEGKLRGGLGRQPTIVHHESRAKSTEGLLNQFEDTEGTDTNRRSQDDSPISPQSDSRSFEFPDNETSKVQRATSVEMGIRHARHISAGSAKLLDIQPRASGETKRHSAGANSHTERP